MEEQIDGDSIAILIEYDLIILVILVHLLEVQILP
jgi:hypothetical protein